MKNNQVTSLSAALSNQNEVTFQFGKHDVNNDDVTSTTSSEETDDLSKPSNIHMFSASSTLHGLSHIFALHHSSLRRFAWTVAFLTSLTLFLLQSSNRIIYYRGYPHVTKIDEVTAGDLNFPAVTICNLNELRFGQLTKNDFFYAGKLLGFLNENNTLIRPEYFDNLDLLDSRMRPKMKDLKQRIERLADLSGHSPTDFNMFDLYDRAGHNIKDYLLSCKYRGGTCNHTSFDEGPKDKELKPSDLVFFASNSTFHGISHIITPSRFTFRKALWAIAFFSSLGLFLIQAYDRYAYYCSHPHVTKLDEEEATEMNFPAITICNMNSFRLGAITTDDYYYAGTILGIFDRDFNLQVEFQDNRTWPQVEEKIRPITTQRSDYKPKDTTFDMFKFYNRTGHTLEEMVKRCRYRGEPCEGPKTWIPVFTRYGKCYTFNSGKKTPPLKTLKGGVDNGLEILLDTQQDEYMPVWKETDEISVEAGFKVQIHSQIEPPFIHELGFGVSPGFQTLVATQEQRVRFLSRENCCENDYSVAGNTWKITFLPEPWGKCVESFDKSFHSLYNNYSISACRITCETNFVYQNCNCQMIHMPGEGPYCTPEVYMKCADKALDYLVTQDEKICVCETPCEVTRYNLEMSSLQLPSTQALSYLAYKYDESEDYVRNNYVKLNIFFEELNYETIEQKVAYEIPGLFGDIGGQMGLFIGASILTILELFDYVYEVIKEKICGTRSRRKKTDVERGTIIEMDKPSGSTKDYIVANDQCVRPNTIDENRPFSYTTYNTYPTRQDEYLQPSNSHSYSMDNNRHRDLEFRSLPPPPVQYTGNSTAPPLSDGGGAFNRTSREYIPRTNASLNRKDVPRRGNELSASYNDVRHHEFQQDNNPPQYSFKRPHYLTEFPNNRSSETATTSFTGNNSNNTISIPRSRPESQIISPTPIVLSDVHNHNQSYDKPTSSKEFTMASIETDIH